VADQRRARQGLSREPYPSLSNQWRAVQRAGYRGRRAQRGSVTPDRPALSAGRRPRYFEQALIRLDRAINIIVEYQLAVAQNGAGLTIVTQRAGIVRNHDQRALRAPVQQRRPAAVTKRPVPDRRDLIDDVAFELDGQRDAKRQETLISRVIRPLVGVSMLAVMRVRVDLPAPLTPMIAIDMLRGKVKDWLSSTCRLPWRV
jgi:hypothetical protein